MRGAIQVMNDICSALRLAVRREPSLLQTASVPKHVPRLAFPGQVR